MKTLTHLLKFTLCSSVLAATALSSQLTLAAEPTLASFIQGDIKRGEQVAQTCQACHAADGSRGLPTYPILQGQHPEYLIKQLTEFKAGKRKNAIMNGMAAPLTEQQIRDVAVFYASKKAKDGVAKDQALVSLGEKIYRGGIAATKTPACAGCHSPDGVGIPAQYPRLAGQHAEYITAQLLAFRAGTFSTPATNAATPARANSQQMTDIAAHLSDKEIAALADYIAGLR